MAVNHENRHIAGKLRDRHLPAEHFLDFNQYSDAIACGYGCLIWKHSTDRKGYAAVLKNGRLVRVIDIIAKHRQRGERTDLSVKCCSKLCINPSHIWYSNHKTRTSYSLFNRDEYILRRP